ncbi:restriction endonuclease [Paludibacter sp.]|uniref:nSTAND3 domain-containing NTPase n=1 Tax=Paludibacter sp. TaxID=1898105 RepID=UPI0013535BE7|nr:restriction endonuclease [Paludibacter sp.]MTK54303.1 AAA family ATPase [Paludibacter sp.]
MNTSSFISVLDEDPYFRNLSSNKTKYIDVRRYLKPNKKKPIMNNYNFTELLSPLRFEQISRDLLRTQYGIFENFAEGKDNGIDFRYSESKNNMLIVQCKRYKNFNNLISVLKNENDKIKKMKFSTYLLVISLDLTVANKDKIVEVFKNKVNPNNILTTSDLNYLLSLPINHHIEFKYPELWMKSINVHQKIFHLGILNHSRFIGEELLFSLVNFVPIEQYDQVINHLESNNIVIISGNPGIGKTTLSHAVISHYLYFNKYQLIGLSYRKIQEAESLLYNEDPCIFYIDDFLGHIKLDKKNDYAQLLLFLIKKIEKSTNKKLIITSREYILRQAHKDLFPINEISNTITKHIIELSSFTRRIRTEILYNYINNSRLPIKYINNLLNSDYKKIIDHKNYNPRIIEKLTDENILRNIQIEDNSYYSYFIENLNNPLRVWQDVYDNFPNKLYKLIIIIRFLIEGELPVKNLEKAVNSIIENSQEYQSFSYDDFEYTIRSLEGTLFSFKDGVDELTEEKYTLIEFQNPSIIDFIDNFIWKKTYWLNLIIKNAIYFEQLFNFELIEIIKVDPTLSKSFRDKILKDFHRLTNANIGYFEYDTQETTFNCWTQGRYLYFLIELLEVTNIEEDEDVAFFLKSEIFRYPFDGTEDISEKQSFCEIATILIERGHINEKDAIMHYTSGFINDVKELVCFEYMTRKCNKESLDIIRNNKEFVEDADNLFLCEINELSTKNFIDLMDFYDDYEQITHILPLKKTTKKLKKLETNSIWKEAWEKLGKNVEENNLTRKVVDNINYFDIEDKSIDSLFKSINKKMIHAAFYDKKQGF